MGGSAEMPRGIGPSGRNGVGLPWDPPCHRWRLLDFYSATRFWRVSHDDHDMGTMVTQYAPSVLAWGGVDQALGGVLLVTALAMGISFRIRRMKASGALITLYGIFMLFTGVSMHWVITPMMQGTL